MSKRSIAGREMIGFSTAATIKINWVETIARQAGLPITIHLGAELAATRDAIAELEEAIKEWMKGRNYAIPDDLLRRVRLLPESHRTNAQANEQNASRDLHNWPEHRERILLDLERAIAYHEKSAQDCMQGKAK